MYNKRKQIYHSKGKNQVLSRLMHGEFLGNLFALTVNGEEVYYKGSGRPFLQIMIRSSTFQMFL